MDSKTDKPSVALRHGNPAPRSEWGRYSLAAFGVVVLLGRIVVLASSDGLGFALGVYGFAVLFVSVVVAFDYRRQMRNAVALRESREGDFALLTTGNFESLVRGLGQDVEVRAPLASAPLRRMLLFLSADGPRVEVVGGGRKPAAGWIQFPPNTEVTVWRLGDEFKSIDLNINGAVKSLRAKGSVDLPNFDSVNWVLN